MSDTFQAEYKKLNPAQKEAVDTTEGPVMVIAGPGTGKTQVLALRIATILKQQTDIHADGILCLTFTNSGVRAMKDRLRRLIGPEADKVTVKTFHSFAGGLVEEYFELLGYEDVPKTLADDEAVMVIDALLENNEWEYIRPRGGATRIFSDLKKLISLLKREGVTSKDLEQGIDEEIARIESDPESISSRGPTKGQMKKTASSRIASLLRTREVATFYDRYEEVKRERLLLDYDDMIEKAVALVREFEDVCATLQERHLYVLIDEHQDSSGAQNDFLELVWGAVEQPNLFVVGDDRQLIYGFGGASLSHFERFKNTFKGTRVISLTENYRSTQAILDTAGGLLESSLVSGPLRSNREEQHALRLVETTYPRDEIIRAGLAIRESGLPLSECAILVPKNAQVQVAATVLADLGIPVTVTKSTSLFEIPEARTMITLLTVLAFPHRQDAIASLLLDPLFGIPPVDAHEYIYTHRRALSVEGLPYDFLQEVLREGMSLSVSKNVYVLIQTLGDMVFLRSAQDPKTLTHRVQVIRTFLHLALAYMERSGGAGSVTDFISFINRLGEYGHTLSLDTFTEDDGVRIMTLHASKGLEYDFVWIAHMDEGSLMRNRRGGGFTLPETLQEKIQARDEMTARRELYVAITRARLFCTISYALQSHSGASQELAHIVPSTFLEKESAQDVESYIISEDPTLYVTRRPLEDTREVRESVIAYVRGTYADRQVAVTHINNFFDCPWKWYFRSFVQLPEPEATHLIFGNLVHRTLEVYFKKGEIADAVYESILDDLHVYDENERRRLLKDAKESISRFIQTYSSLLEENKKAEYKPKEVIHGSLSIVGKIDLVEEVGENRVRVTDFKTNAQPLTKNAIEKEDEEGRMSQYLRQLVMYSFLLAKEKRTAVSSRLVFLEAEDVVKSAYETTITDEHIDRLKKDISDFEEALESGSWVDRPCHEKECQYCDLAKQVGLL